MSYQTDAPGESLANVWHDATLRQLLHSAVELARMCLGMDVAFISEISNGRRIFRKVACTAGFDPVKAGNWDPLEQSYCQHIVSGEIPDLIGDSHAIPSLKSLRATSDLSIRAYMGVPIRLSDGSIYGTFCCYSRSPKTRLRDSDRIAMNMFAQLIGQMLDERILRERERARKAATLSAAINEGAMSVVYQPIVDVATRRPVGYEALARFATTPARPPDQWFADAHTVELGVELERIAAELALSNIDGIETEAYLSINLSAQALVSGSLDACLLAAPAHRLVLEVTEHLPVEEYEPLMDCLARFRDRGLRLAIDDAGSGYASFRHILRLQPDIIKLDQSLIRNIDADADRRSLALALITFARETGCRIVAEGVETKAELDMLSDLGVDSAQGYLLGHPASRPAASPYQ